MIAPPFTSGCILRCCNTLNSSESVQLNARTRFFTLVKSKFDWGFDVVRMLWYDHYRDSSIARNEPCWQYLGGFVAELTKFSTVPAKSHWLTTFTYRNLSLYRKDLSNNLSMSNSKVTNHDLASYCEKNLSLLYRQTASTRGHAA